MPPFLMMSDKRARKVAADLIALLSERGVSITNKQARNATARIYGHADWPAMLGSMGSGHSPDDAELDAIMLADRRAHQLAVLETLDIPEHESSLVLDRLAPTGRTAGDVGKVEVVRFKHGLGLYHPYRLLTAEQNLSAFLEEPEGVLTPLDAIMAGARVGDQISGFAFDVCDRGVFVDASAMSSVARSPQEEADDFRRLLGSMKDAVLYVHLGTNRYPSPWLSCGIEGCYLMAGPAKERLFVLPVVSPEHATADVLVDEMENGFSPKVTLMHCSRGQAFSLSYDEVDRRWLMAVGGVPSLPWDDEALEQALRDAVAGALAHLENSLGVASGVSVEYRDAVVTRLQRARTGDQVRRAVEEVAREQYEVVRFVGGVPSYALTGQFVPPPEVDRIAFQALPSRVREQHLEAWSSMAESSNGATAIAMADRIIALAPERANRTPEMAEVVVLAHSIKAAAMHEALRMSIDDEDMTACFEVAHAGVDHTALETSTMLLPFLAASTDGDPRRVREAVGVLRTLQTMEGFAFAVAQDDLLLWSVALITALAGEDASKWVATGVARNDSIRARLLDPDVEPNDQRFGRDEWFAGEEAVEILGKAWLDVPDREQVLAAAPASTLH